MSARPHLSSLEGLFASGKDFSLSDMQYHRKTGCHLPQDSYYLKTNSAIAKMARKFGFSVQVIEKQVIFRK